MSLSPEQKVAAALLAKKDEEKLSYEKIAEQVGIDSKTLYNWRQDPEFMEEVALATGQSVDELLIQELRANPNPHLFNTYYKRFGLFRDEDVKDVGALLQMTDEERQQIIDYIVRAYGKAGSSNGPGAS